MQSWTTQMKTVPFTVISTYWTWFYARYFLGMLEALSYLILKQTTPTSKQTYPLLAREKKAKFKLTLGSEILIHNGRWLIYE